MEFKDKLNAAMQRSRMSDDTLSAISGLQRRAIYQYRKGYYAPKIMIREYLLLCAKYPQKKFERAVYNSAGNKISKNSRIVRCPKCGGDVRVIKKTTSRMGDDEYFCQYCLREIEIRDRTVLMKTFNSDGKLAKKEKVGKVKIESYE